MFNAHHTGISVRDVARSIRFYEAFGFREKHRWVADDNTLTIVHLALDDYFLELFGYASNAYAPAMRCDIGNDLERLGVKHLAVAVSDLASTRASLEELGSLTLSESTKGRMEIQYFFVRDPDGMWLEVVQDDRLP